MRGSELTRFCIALVEAMRCGRKRFTFDGVEYETETARVAAAEWLAADAR